MVGSASSFGCRSSQGPELTLACLRCSGRRISAVEFLSHVEGEHVGAGSFDWWACTACDFEAASLPALVLHCLRSEHPVRQIRCKQMHRLLSAIADSQDAALVQAHGKDAKSGFGLPPLMPGMGQAMGMGPFPFLPPPNSLLPPGANPLLPPGPNPMMQQGPNPMMQQGPNPMMQQGPNPMMPPGPNQLLAQGPNPMMPQGANPLPPQPGPNALIHGANPLPGQAPPPTPIHPIVPDAITSEDTEDAHRRTQSRTPGRRSRTRNSHHTPGPPTQAAEEKRIKAELLSRSPSEEPEPPPPKRPCPSPSQSPIPSPDPVQMDQRNQSELNSKRSSLTPSASPSPSPAPKTSTPKSTAPKAKPMPKSAAKTTLAVVSQNKESRPGAGKTYECPKCRFRTQAAKNESEADVLEHLVSHYVTCNGIKIVRCALCHQTGSSRMAMTGHFHKVHKEAPSSPTHRWNLSPSDERELSARIRRDLPNLYPGISVADWPGLRADKLVSPTKAPASKASSAKTAPSSTKTTMSTKPTASVTTRSQSSPYPRPGSAQPKEEPLAPLAKIQTCLKCSKSINVWRSDVEGKVRWSMVVNHVMGCQGMAPYGCGVCGLRGLRPVVAKHAETHSPPADVVCKEDMDELNNVLRDEMELFFPALKTRLPYWRGISSD